VTKRTDVLERNAAGASLKMRIITVFIDKKNTQSAASDRVFPLLTSRGNLASERFNFFNGQSGEIYACARRDFSFPPFIGIVRLPNAAVLLPFTSLPNYQFPERLTQLD